MEFPNEIKCYILSYLPHPYKKPTHVEAINKTPMFADLTIDRLLTKNDYLWMNSYIEYKKLRNFELLHRT
jgi:hypothetical protein